MFSEVRRFLTYHDNTRPIVAERPTELRKIDVDVVTFGQYMRPTKKHMKVDRYVDPVEFDRWKQIAEDMGFLYVASGPLVRSSYKVGVDDSYARSFSLSNLFSRRVNTSSRMYFGLREQRDDHKHFQLSIR
jgi:hypothetical protein